ncbi:recombinase family protein [Ruminiclostridium josui]|uniref:recombinase family protein n=1 Tax=Ruminiclostridium josui TaxID=1499 RepID=UPI0004645B3E|nr:recombinase family protein [Ruminiclostridium josui]
MESHKAEIVERIYSEYLSGKGTFTIAKQLAADNIPTVAGGKWCESTILGILKWCIRRRFEQGKLPSL